MRLADCRITNARALPGQQASRPPIHQCNVHLQAELAAMPRLLKVIVALGAIAHRAVLRACRLKRASYVFGHNVSHALPDGRLLVNSYHCSGYNWRTGRLSREGFEAVFAGIRARLGNREAPWFETPASSSPR